jgi:Fe-S-cluster containining protein
MFDNFELCKECGGICCNRSPGAAFPEDFGLPGDTSKLITAINSGKWAIDWWEGDPRKCKNTLTHAFYLRPAVIGHEGQIFHASWGGRCVMLINDKCSLKSNSRPRECRYLEPSSKFECKMHGKLSKQDASIAWIPYTDLLENMKENAIS